MNGVAKGFFSSSIGLWQGDPLLPLLFLCVMEALSRMIGTVSRGYLSSYVVGEWDGSMISISQLLFADDTISIIFCGAQ